MFGTISGEMEVNVPASAAWEVYNSLKLANIAEKGLSQFVEKIEVVEGDGSQGTILKLVFLPGLMPFKYYKEKFTMINEEKMVKEAEVVEGGYLEMGFNRYMVRFEIIEKDEKTCITKSTIEYELKEDSAANAAAVSIEPLMTIMKLAADHLCSETSSH